MQVSRKAMGWFWVKQQDLSTQYWVCDVEMRMLSLQGYSDDLHGSADGETFEDIVLQSRKWATPLLSLKTQNDVVLWLLISAGVNGHALSSRGSVKLCNEQNKGVFLLFMGWKSDSPSRPSAPGQTLQPPFVCSVTWEDTWTRSPPLSQLCCLSFRAACLCHGKLGWRLSWSLGNAFALYGVFCLSPPCRVFSIYSLTVSALSLTFECD